MRERRACERSPQSAPTARRHKWGCSPPVSPAPRSGQPPHCETPSGRVAGGACATRAAASRTSQGQAASPPGAMGTGTTATSLTKQRTQALLHADGTPRLPLANHQPTSSGSDHDPTREMTIVPRRRNYSSDLLYCHHASWPGPGRGGRPRSPLAPSLLRVPAFSAPAAPAASDVSGGSHPVCVPWWRTTIRCP